jgi:hypothetical protein
VLSVVMFDRHYLGGNRLGASLKLEIDFGERICPKVNPKLQSFSKRYSGKTKRWQHGHFSKIIWFYNVKA